MSVPNSNPPMMAAANEPNMASVSKGIIPKMVVREAILTGRKRLNQHTYQSQRPHYRNKIESLSSEQHDCHHSHKDKRNTTENNNRFAIIFKQHNQDSNHQDNSQWKILE